MSFQPLRSITQALLSGVRRHRLVTSLIAAGVLVAGLATPLLVQAQCVQSGNNFTCSGNVTGTTVTGSSSANIFSFLDDVMGNLTVVSGGGNDTLDFSAFNSYASVSLSFGLAQTVRSGLQITFQGFNTADTNYTLKGPEAAGNTLQGGAGNDTIYGSSSTDELYGGAGNDTIYGGAGSDYIEGNDGDDVLSGSKDVDTLNGGDGFDERNDKGSSCIEDTISNIEKDSCVTGEGGEESEIKAEVPAPHAAQMCVTRGSSMDLTDRDMIVIYSDYANTPNGMIITEIPLASVRPVTDDEKTTNAWVPLLYKESEFAPGWSVGLYWHENHYGVVVYKDYGKTIVDDTGAICGWF